MNVNEVPQDPKNFKEGGKMRKLVYAVDIEGNYTGVNSVGWDAENEALKQAWDAVDETLADTEEKVRNGKLSPIAYFMQKNLMDVSLLCRYIGKWKWQVRRHMKPGVFKKLDAKLLQAYAGIFNVTVEELKKFGKDK
jgi:hypothetical protein